MMTKKQDADPISEGEDALVVLIRWPRYSVPEIIALPILVGSSDYLRWVAESTEPGTTHDLA
jgi:uncharacterized protein involved in tolerance to divalent cations